jgi:hypothetical protein
MKRDRADHCDGVGGSAGAEAAWPAKAVSTTTTAAVSSGVGWPETIVSAGRESGSPGPGPGPAPTGNPDPDSGPDSRSVELLELSEVSEEGWWLVSPRPSVTWLSLGLADTDAELAVDPGPERVAQPLPRLLVGPQ